MKTNIFFPKLIILLLCSWMTFASAQSSQNDPVGLLQFIANNMISGLKANQATLKTKPAVVYSLARKYVVPYADLSEMSKRVLPPNIWNNASAGQRQQFQKAFTTLLIRTYASGLTAYRDQAVQFYPIRGGYQGKNMVEVRSEIQSSAHSPIQVTYRLIRKGNTWKLFDMSVEGVSLIESFRSQFADILSGGNMNDLLNRLNTHNER